MLKYSISDFYLLLKLGLFRSGNVSGWGYLSVNGIRSCFLRKPPEAYTDNYRAKKQLGIGIYLLDLYLWQKSINDRDTYILVISVNRNILSHNTKVYVLKLRSCNEITDTADIREAVEESAFSSFYDSSSSSYPDRRPRRRKSIFRKRPNKPGFDFSPLNAKRLK